MSKTAVFKEDAVGCDLTTFERKGWYALQKSKTRSCKLNHVLQHWGVFFKDMCNIVYDSCDRAYHRTNTGETTFRSLLIPQKTIELKGNIQIKV